MEMQFDLETGIQLLVSFVIGTAIGIEREYRSKAAGLRTMIMICLGSTVFTELSMTLGVNSPDRIASNIITGIGFLGAGVIFKDGLSISGITTATTIWITAALGMAVGAGEYFIALIGSLVVLVVLTLFETVQKHITRRHQERAYKITFHGGNGFSKDLEGKFEQLNLGFRREKDLKGDGHFTVLYELYGRERDLNALNEMLKTYSNVVSYEY